MKSIFSLAILALCSLPSKPALAALEGVKPSQAEYEKSINAVVRNKEYYKSGHIELTGLLGTMPFDSIVNHLLLGGRGTWHLSDHIGWEVLEALIASPSVSNYTTGLVTNYGISNLQTSQIKMLLSSNILISPIYGKFRFFGSSVMFYDVYAVIGLGVAKTDVLKFSSPAIGTTGTMSTLSSGMDPMLNIGVGFKFFVNHALGIVIDFRDYVTYSTLYGKKTLGSNFSVSAGLSFFLPTF